MTGDEFSGKMEIRKPNSDFALHIGGRANGEDGKPHKQSIDGIIVNHFAYSMQNNPADPTNPNPAAGTPGHWAEL